MKKDIKIDLGYLIEQYLKNPTERGKNQIILLLEAVLVGSDQSNESKQQLNG